MGNEKQEKISYLEKQVKDGNQMLLLEMNHLVGQFRRDHCVKAHKKIANIVRKKTIVIVERVPSRSSAPQINDHCSKLEVRQAMDGKDERLKCLQRDLLAHANLPEGGSCLLNIWKEQKRKKIVWIVLSIKDTLNYLKQPISPAPVPEAGQQVALEILAAHAARKEGQSVSSYVLKMKSYIDNIERLRHPVSLNLGVSLIFISLRKEIDSFVHNYNMHSMGKTVNELHAMLKLHEQTLTNKALALHAIRAGKRNCPQYLAELLKNKKLSQGASSSGIFTIELYTFSNKSWVYDTGCGTHICKTTQGLRGSRKLKPRDLSLYVGNGGIILVSRLYDDGYVNRFVDNTIQVPMDGIFEIELFNSKTNDSSMYVVSKKRVKLNLDSALWWHCRLRHISKKRIEMLQHDGLLNSTDLRAFEKCVPCMSRKMARKPYTHQVEMAKDLLGLIHTDVCSPFKIMSRQGASYFVNFTDDFSRDRSRRLIGLCLSAYIEKILKRFHMENYKRGSILMQDKLRLSKSQGASTPAELKRMNTKDMFLIYGGDLKREFRVSCYTDAGYLTDADDLKSQTGYVFVLNRSVVDWKSTKHSIFATSFTEREYIAAYDAYKEVVWVRKFIYGHGFVSTIEEPINMYCNNT
nr:hypothetical protein [Tanacetum cinerariifolium]